MKQTVNFTDFTRAFHDYDRYDQFGYSALRALFDYLEDYEDNMGGELELDVIALCCDWTAYCSAVDACSEYTTGIELQKTVYTAGWNMAGYMPDSEPVQFDDLGEARDYMEDNIELYADSLAESTDDSAESVAALYAIAEQVREGDGEYRQTVAGWHYWITAETVENEDAEEQCMDWLRENTVAVEYDGGVLVMAF